MRILTSHHNSIVTPITNSGKCMKSYASTQSGTFDSSVTYSLDDKEEIMDGR